MTFFERMNNVVISLIDWVVRRFVHFRYQSEIAEKYFGHLTDLPSIDDILKNVSAILVNTHRSVIPPRPTMPGIAYVGGAHVKKPKPLPDDLQKFLDGAKYGAIFFSFGTFVQSNGMPPERMNALLEAFKQIKQRIIWKYDDDKIENLPENILIRKWLPQNDILAHKNIVLFISHGNLSN